MAMCKLFEKPAIFCVLVVFMMSLWGCTTNPYTERSQLLLVSESEEMGMGEQSYQQILSDPKVQISQNPTEVNPVQRVAQRIIEAAKISKYAERAKQFSWEVNVIKDDNTPNAFALPGGKIAVYTGIFPAARNESGLAAIMGHEVVHALARHGAERYSQGLVAQFGMAAASVALAGGGVDPASQQLAMQALGLGAQVGILLPFSRSHETEADYVGLLLAAQAGYDPQEAVRVWERMAQASQGQPAEFMSTHPNHETRIADLQRWMPQALAIYNQVPKATVTNLPPITPQQKPSSAQP